MADIRLDYNFCMGDSVEGGLTKDDIQNSLDAAARGFEKLSRMVVSDEIGFTKLPEFDTREILDFSKSINGIFNDMIVVGIGGSALGVEAIVNALLPYGYNVLKFPERGYFPRIWVADNVDPSKIHQILSRCIQQDTLVVVITKSGSTVETISNFDIILNWLNEGSVDIKKHVVTVTDPKSGSLKKFSDIAGLKSFSIPKNVGGRFSILSPVGLLPAALLGLNIKKMLIGASDALKNEKQFLMLTALYHAHLRKKSINVLMPYTHKFEKFSEWFCQLWGESLGKKNDISGNKVFSGTTPVRAIGSIDQHSQIQLYKEGPNDKIITFVELSDHDFDKKVENVFYEDFNYLEGVSLSKLLNAELHATELSLMLDGRPNLKLTLDVADEYSLGYLFMLFELVVAVLGLSINIDPFDQPGVEEGKNFAYGLLGRKNYKEKLEEFNKFYKKSDDYIV